MQSKIYKSSNSFNFKHVLVNQKIFLNSFSVRLHVVKNFVEYLDQSLNNYFLFNSLDKIYLAINLKNYKQFSIGEISSIHFLKNFGISYGLFPIGFYDICLDFLVSFSLRPILESTKDRSQYKFRSYKQQDDLFLSLRSRLDNNNRLNFWLFNEIDLSTFFGLQDNFFMLKDFPLNRFFLKNWIEFCMHSCLRSYLPCLFYNFVDFIFNGLVRFGFECSCSDLFIII